MTSTLKTILTFLILIAGSSISAQWYSSNVFQAIQKPDSIKYLSIKCPHYVPANTYPCDTVPNEIASLNRLKTIYAVESKFCCLPETFKNLDSLEFLSIGSNPNFKTSELCKLVGLPRLKTLHLSSLNITELPSCIGQIQSLERVALNLNGLNYSQAIQVLSELSTLKSLYINLQENQPFPDNIQQLEKLLYLSLDNSFVDIQDLVKHCSSMNLRGLSLAGLLISELIEDFSRMNSLEGLDLERNCFDSIPKEILKLENLRFLSLRNNNDKSDFFLGDEISRLEQLEYLDISNTRINRLPYEITKLYKLKFLNIYLSEVNDLTSIIPLIQNLKHLNVDFKKGNLEEIEKLKELCPNLIITNFKVVQFDYNRIIAEMMKE